MTRVICISCKQDVETDEPLADYISSIFGYQCTECEDKLSDKLEKMYSKLS